MLQIVGNFDDLKRSDLKSKYLPGIALPSCEKKTGLAKSGGKFRNVLRRLFIIVASRRVGD